MHRGKVLWKSWSHGRGFRAKPCPQIYDNVGGETDMKRDQHKVFLGLMHLPL